MEFLSGLHPRIIHFPIAFFVLYFIFETVGATLKKEAFTKTAFFILALGVITAILSVLTGNQAHETAKNFLVEGEAYFNQLIKQHENFATLSLWYFTILFFIRMYLVIKKNLSIKVQYLFVFFSLLGCVLILLTGYYGGVLVFEHGIGTKLFK